MERLRQTDRDSPGLHLVETARTDATGSPAAHCVPTNIVFVVQKISHIWNVTMEGIFYGDFAEERSALEEVQRVVRAIRKAGGTAQIRFRPSTGQSGESP